MRLQVFWRKENPVMPLRQSKLLIHKHWIVTVQLLLSWHRIVTVWPLFKLLTISRVIELCFKRDWSCWNDKTPGYKFFEGRRTQFYPQNSQNCSSTNQTYCPIGYVMTQSRFVTHNWSSITPNWARPISLVIQHPKLQFLWRNLILIPASSYSKSLWKSRDETVLVCQPFHLHTTHEVI
jgi:hypothetical protein